MLIRQNGSKYSYYYIWENTKYAPYNYAKEGLLKHIMSRKIVETKNTSLKYILALFESSMVFLMKYIDELKNFKNITWKNR